MKNRLIILGLLFALLALALPALAQQPPTPEGDLSPGRTGYAPPSTGGMGMAGSRWMGESPELAQLVRDINALREINRADLTAEQIGKVLPVIKNLAKQQTQMVDQVKGNLLAERARLLKAQGPEKAPSRPLNLLDSTLRYRNFVEEAQQKISGLVSAPQADILNGLITPPGLPMGARPKAGDADNKSLTPEARAERLKTLRPTRPGRAQVELGRLIELLEEKQAALPKVK
jgi:hypothetical protein